MLLSIDTSSKIVSVALYVNEKEIYFQEEQMERGQGEALIPMIQTLMTKAHHDVSELKGVAVAVGPGSFTGVRIGLATARAMALALNIPVYGVTNFEALAIPLKKPVLVALDTKRGDYFVQSFDKKETALDEPHIETIDSLKTKLPFTVIGDVSDELVQTLGCNKFEIKEPSAVSIAKVALSRVDKPLPAVPLYLREADVTV